ncbi:MAG: S49 family peptidase [Alphaproteobacteria bacterium]|nr:S49 family peptidase [Alphaproteobacteria bacterium]
MSCAMWPFDSGRVTAPVIRLEGLIASRGAGRGLSLNTVEPALERAFAMKRTPIVALSINSPGGSAVQSRLITQRIRQLAAQKKKRVLAFVEDIGASGGYMLACAGDEIFVDPSSIVGSIGVIGGGFGFPELMAKIGVERRVYTAGAVKGRLDAFRPEDPDDVARLQAILDHIHEVFIGLVRERRAGKLKETPMLFQGEVFTAQEAIASGLVDGFGDLHSVLAARYGETVRLKRVQPPKPSLLRRLMGGAGDALVETMEERAAFARFGL